MENVVPLFTIQRLKAQCTLLSNFIFLYSLHITVEKNTYEHCDIVAQFMSTFSFLNINTNQIFNIYVNVLCLPGV